MLKVMGRHSYLGLEFGVGIILGYYLGSWLDEVFGTAPVLMYVTMALGMGVGWVDLFLLVKKTDLDKMDDF
jgi:F0F1-type ATP synthase assembly protein I